MKKKSICLFLVLLMALSIVPANCFAAQSSSISTGFADALYGLGLFSGTGKNADGTPIYSLEKAPTRAEAITMLVRLLGKESEAKSKEWNIPFDDVDDWAKPYVGYAYNNGLTSGVSANKFDSNSKASEAQYITFILRALGYSDAKGDFAWDNSKQFSNKLGITKGDANSNFLRADVTEVSYFALKTKMKNSEKTLIDTLYANHAVSTTKMPDLAHTRKPDSNKVYLPEETIDGVSYRDLAKACGCDPDIAYIKKPKTEADHLNNIKYIMLTGQWTYKKSDNSSVARRSWGNCERSLVGEMSYLSRLYGQIFGVFANYWCDFYYENGKYTLYCSIDPILSPQDIQKEFVEAYKIIDAKYDEFIKIGKLNAQSTDYQKMKVFADWLTEFSYDTKQRDVLFPEASLTETAYGYLGRKYANCVGRAAAVSMAWSYVGLPAYTSIVGHKPGNWEGHLLPWTIIDGQEYTCESYRQPGLCKVASDGSAVEATAYFSMYFITAARKELGLSYNKEYDPADPTLWERNVGKCTAYSDTIPCTIEFRGVNEAGEEMYFVKVADSYTETEPKKYIAVLTTNGGNGRKSVYGIRDLETMKAGVLGRITKEQRLDALTCGMDKIGVIIY